jgi:hypothetical protein
MVKDFNPVIGKNVLETLTEGMYDDARFIYREYIQNAADQIDLAVEEQIFQNSSEGLIQIIIDANSRSISIQDNATGISQKDVLKFLGDVANSQKDGKKQKGFRGIGRLGGLGYCETLEFETSFIGENTGTRLVLDATLLRKIIKNRSDNSDAAGVISVITSIQKFDIDEASHFFKVKLNGVSSDVLLDSNSVREYLSMVAPVPFSSKFKFTDTIKDNFFKKNLVLDEYNIEINNETLFKAYKNEFIDDKGISSELLSVEFFDIRNDNQEIIAVCWYSFNDRINLVLGDNIVERGLRIKSKNITIGNQNTCSRFFDQARTNFRFIGEIHTVGDGFVPNSRRDYFVENSTCLQFQKNAKDILKEENLENKLAQTASKLHNKVKEILVFNETAKTFLEQKGGYESSSIENFQINKLKELQVKAEKAKSEIESINRRTQKSESVKVLYNKIVANKDLNLTQLTNLDLSSSEYDPPKFPRLTDDQSLVVMQIFELIEEHLEFDQAENLKKIIIKHFR